MSRLRAALCFAFTVTSCAHPEPASRPPANAGVATAESPPPQPSATASAATPPAASSAPSAQPSDPLLSQPADCGPERPNPHGISLEWMTRKDGSCRVCEQAPAALSPCKPGERGVALTERSIEAHRGKRVKLEGSVVLSHAACTKRGGPCACNNRCSAVLRLDLEGLESPSVTLSSRGEPMSCSGDEGSLCCPFALDPATRSARVIVSGTLTSPATEGVLDAGPPLYLEVASVCSVK